MIAIKSEASGRSKPHARACGQVGCGQGWRWRHNTNISNKPARSACQAGLRCYEFGAALNAWWPTWRRWRCGQGRNVGRRHALPQIALGLGALKSQGDKHWRSTTPHTQGAMRLSIGAGADRTVRMEHHLDHAHCGANHQLVLRIDPRRCHRHAQRQSKPQQGQSGQPGCVAKCVQQGHGARL